MSRYLACVWVRPINLCLEELVLPFESLLVVGTEDGSARRSTGIMGAAIALRMRHAPQFCEKLTSGSVIRVSGHISLQAASFVAFRPDSAFDSSRNSWSRLRMSSPQHSLKALHCSQSGRWSRRSRRETQTTRLKITIHLHYPT
jgi:hypothetical protein